MYYIIYKTTNTINGKWYIGFHSTKDINDNYLGSGKLLKKAIEKYGKDSFEREILYVYNSKIEALLKEKEIVDKLVVDSKNSYNIKIGGKGGWDHITEKINKDILFRESLYKKSSETLKKLHKEGKLKRWKEYNEKNKERNYRPFFKKNHSEASKKKISENNGRKLTEEQFHKRIKDYENEEKSRGYISRLSKKWNLSHTSVKRFISLIQNKNKIEE